MVDKDLLSEMLSQCHEAYEKSARDWKPEPGEYTCILTELELGKWEARDDKPAAFYIRPIFQIIGDTNLDGEIFRGDPRNTRNSVSTQFLRSFLQTFQQAHGVTKKLNLGEGISLAEQSVGAVCTVKIELRNETYLNDTLVNIVEIPDSTSEAKAPE